MSFENYPSEPQDHWDERPRANDQAADNLDPDIAFTFGACDGEDAGDGSVHTPDGEGACLMPEYLAELGSGGANPMDAPEIDNAAESTESQAAPSVGETETSTTNELPLPAGVKEILNESIVLPSARMSGVNTLKFTVDGHPDLLVRFNPQATIDEVRTAKNSLDHMTQHGVTVLPSTIVPNRGGAYVVTQVVNGSELQEALADNPSPELLDDVDRTWKGVCDNLIDCYQNGRPIPGDVVEPEQWMYGTTATDHDPKVRLVDLSYITVPSAKEDAFAFEVVGVIDAINSIEELTDRPMTAARQAVENALGICPESPEFGDGIINAVRHALENRIIIYRGWGSNVDIIRQMQTHPAQESIGATSTDSVVAHEMGDKAADISDEAITTNELPLPDDITGILDTSLIDAGMRGANTQKYYVDGHPDLLVRLNPGIVPEMAQEAKASADRMTQHGVKVPPSTIVLHGDETYVVTQLVDGRDLREALIDNPSDEFLNEVDQTWKGVCDGLVACHQTGSPMPSDVVRPEQYMHGTTATDHDPRVWLVDLPCYSIPQSEIDRLAFELLETANAVNDIERITGRTMTATRQAIEEALLVCPDSEEFGDGVSNSIRHALAEGIIVYGRDDVDFINQMRTR